MGGGCEGSGVGPFRVHGWGLPGVKGVGFQGSGRGCALLALILPCVRVLSLVRDQL